ncbi:metal-dependent hydrolase family protein [Marinomonas mediterranea]|uniref:Amidohydrolase n=2 Tax=Marinomonas mediterranea TaxID=119864 RepID=F2K426_MARM1|nr:amidohydrolase family protein [Marinomonas mediterranea]ADZ91368.1 amidohydrolase [Marinomonas mediterranea MMB-1]WCN09341.1 amidohydrolase family protein [Marinomonas mediterranea]WCN17486.1 amidohydrolase family protein [Marinomonas mediterranea MMB-1]
MKTILIQGGKLYNGLGDPVKKNPGLIIKNGIFQQVGVEENESHQLLSDPKVIKINATNKWIMPGLIDGHCHLTFGHPDWSPIIGDGNVQSAELCTLRAAENAKSVLMSGVTGISIPGGAWFTDVAIRDAIKHGIIQGPHIFAAGRFISTYGSIADTSPTSIESPHLGIGVLTNTKEEMLKEVRYQVKNGVDLIKVGDSPWGDEQMISYEELKVITNETHRRKRKVTIHARGAGSTQIAANAGVDWIMHADYAREEELEIVAKKKIPIMPTISALEVVCNYGNEHGVPQSIIDKMRYNLDQSIIMLELAKEFNIKLLCGTDSGNSPIMKYGKYHALELDMLVKYAGYSPEMAIKAATSDNAITLGMEGKIGAIAINYIADLIIMKDDPSKKFSSIHNDGNIQCLIQKGHIVQSIFGEI